MIARVTYTVSKNGSKNFTGSKFVICPPISHFFESRVVRIIRIIYTVVCLTDYAYVLPKTKYLSVL